MPSKTNGGRREGSGRKLGKGNLHSVQRETEAKKTGAMPAEILLTLARYHAGRFATAANLPAGTKDREDLLRFHGGEARIAARDAAPYYHSRFATIRIDDTPNPDDGKQIDVTDYSSLDGLTEQQVIILYQREIKKGGGV